MEVPEAASSGHHLLRFAQTALDPGSHVNLEGSRNDPLGAQVGLALKHDCCMNTLYPLSS